MIFESQSSLYLLYISTIAGLATTAGCVIVLLLGDPPERLLALLLAAAGGVMLAVVAIDLIPLAVSFKSPAQSVAGFVSGIAFMAAADKILKHRHKKKPGSRFHRLKRIGILIASGIALHDIPEGMAIAVGQESTAHLGTMIAVGIALHNLPEGMAMATPLIMAGIRREKILALTFAIAFFTPFGALLGKAALALVSSSMCYLVTLAAGAMTFLVLVELWPLARERYPLWAVLGGFSGFIFFVMISAWLPH